MQQGLGHVRVVDLSTGIAGAYACRLFADAGADVIKVEPPEGDPGRRWSATGAPLGDDDGALFRFLHHGVRSVVGRPGEPGVDTLISGADVVVDSAVPPSVDVAALRAADPGVVVVSITPFGLNGPYAGRPATEFTVQAESGCTGVRGLPTREPLMAGARIGEWVAGTYAAAAAAAAWWRSRGDGHGEHVDLSMLEVLNVAGTTCTDLTWSLFGRPPLDGAPPARSVETPSIEPTSDGWVGFTTNSRQQFDDFLVLIERPDLLGDEKLARHLGRANRLEEWNAILRPWTTAHTTEEVIERATLLRIPVTPIGNGATVTGLDHFVERKVFLDDPTGTFTMPRRPWMIGGEAPPAPSPSPRLGEHTDRVEPHPRAHPQPRGEARLPFEGLRVLDLTAWWAGPAASHVLAALGAEVIHVESVERMDGMRSAVAALRGRDQWWERSAIFLAANANKLGITLDLSRPEGVDLALRLVAVSDVVMENFTPRVLDGFGLGWDALVAANPRVILVRMPAFGLTGPWRDRTGFAQTMEQLSGLAWVTGYADDQPRIQRGPSDPNAGLHAAFAVVVALTEREATGRGQHVEVTMVEAALNSAAEQLVEYSAYGRLLDHQGNRAPGAAPQGLYACQGTERWLAVSVETDAQWRGLTEALGRPSWAADPDLAAAAGRAVAQDAIDERLGAWAQGCDLDDAVTTLLAHGVPAAPVVDPRATAAHPQLAARPVL